MANRGGVKKTCNSISFITLPFRLFFTRKKKSHPFAVNLRSSSTMNVVGTSFFFVTCSDCPFVDDFFVRTVFFPVLRKQCCCYSLSQFALNYVWILLLRLLLLLLLLYLLLQSNYFHSKWHVI